MIDIFLRRHTTILGWITRERGHCDNYALYSARVYTYLRNSSNVDKHHAIDSNYMRGGGVGMGKGDYSGGVSRGFSIIYAS